MRRYRCDLDFELGSEIEIQDELFKHIVIVCRNQIGQQFELLKNKSAYLSELVQIDKKSARLKILSERIIPDLPEPAIHIALANPKISVLESIVEKSVELGVSSISLLVTERSFFKSVDKIRLKEKRLKKIISQALQQSNRYEDLQLPSPQNFLDFLTFYSQKKNKSGFMLYARSDVKTLMGLDLKKNEPGDIYLLIGPEGGFTDPEVNLATEYGFQSLSLGHQVLRVETACVAGVSILKSRLQIW